MNSIAAMTDQMTKLYVFVDDYLKEPPAQAAWRRSNNAAPAFPDAEVVAPDCNLWQRFVDCNLSWQGTVEYAQDATLQQDAALQLVSRRLLACLGNPRLGFSKERAG